MEEVIYEEHHLEDYTQRLGDWGLGVQWRCNCPEFLTVVPNTARPTCRHVEAAIKLALVSPVT
jgi:hypothetical protein